MSRAAKFPWDNLECEVEGTLDRVDGVTQFVTYATRATLAVPLGADHGKARELLEKAEKVCLVANSLRGVRTLEQVIAESAA